MRITEDRWPDLVRSLKKAADELSDIWPLRVRQRTMTPLIVATGAVR